MPQEVELAIHLADVMTFEADVLALKHDTGFMGSAASVMARIMRGEPESWESFAPKLGEAVAVRTNGTMPVAVVVFVGLPSPGLWGYRELRGYATKAIQHTASALPNARHIVLRLHGPGTGLDEAASFLALVEGVLEGLGTLDEASELIAISVVESDSGRYARLQLLLEQRLFGEVFAHATPSRAACRINVALLKTIRSLRP